MAKFTNNMYRDLLKVTVRDPIVSQSNTETFYFTAGRVDEWEGGPFEPDPETGEYSQSVQVRTNLIAGVRVQANQVAFMGNKNIWASNTVYTTFDNKSSSAAFYVINGGNDVYKCISNNNDSPSTVEPTSTYTSGTFQTADGYVWKYMTTINASDLTTFGSTSTIPLISNAAVVSNAIAGTIDAISVVDPGAGYTKYRTGKVGAQVSTTLIRVNNVVDEGVGYYADCSFAIVGGTGVGSLRQISNSVSNSSGNFITVSSPITVDLTSQFIISPRLSIAGDGAGATGYVNIDNGAVSNVVIISPGTGYSYATLTVTSDTTIPCSLRAHVSPRGGHGSDLISELDSTSVAIVGAFPKTLGRALPNDITYYQFGLIKSPQHSNGSVMVSNVVSFATSFATPADTLYVKDETLRGITSNATGTVMSSNTTLTYLKNVTGGFLSGEAVVGTTTNVESYITDVQSSSFDKLTGDLLYYVDVSAINRTDTIESEHIRCIINIEG